ncbi:diguanylate cyclase [Vibrio sp. TBV020]|uniref:sensor domain-containing diguanylate cyclase n=1 Tax=Vibrio sp. TBV020 TaxID=3137398 RepID=UPI0038CD6A7F
MRIIHLSLKQLTLFASLMMASVFVCCYLTFRYFWVYDSEVEQALRQQSEETNRVKTVLDLQKSDLASALVDYAAWDEVDAFIQGKNHSFLETSLNAHSFTTKQLSGVFIFDKDMGLVWGQLYDYLYKRELSYDEIRYKFGALMADTLRSRTDIITPYVKLLVLNDKPTMLATARVCNSDGMDCDKGFMMFIRPIDSEFSRTLKQATGLNVEIVTTNKSAEQLTSPNITVLEKLDYQNQSTVRVLVHHSAKLPDFITWGELSMLLAFALFMFAFNLSVVHMMVRPIKRARNALNSLSHGGSIVTDEENFISHEMRDFVCRINEVYAQLDEKQQELEWIARHDALTEVGNRRSLQQYWQEKLRLKDHGYACVALIDVDFFKPFNDHYGHLEGDVVLNKVAQQLKKSEGDCEQFVARFGGEEFCVVLTSHTPINANAEGERLRQAIEELDLAHCYSPISTHLTVSIGVADCGSQSLAEQQEILLLADKALYQAKNQGRNRVVIKEY